MKTSSHTVTTDKKNKEDEILEAALLEIDEIPTTKAATKTGARDPSDDEINVTTAIAETKRTGLSKHPAKKITTYGSHVSFGLTAMAVPTGLYLLESIFSIKPSIPLATVMAVVIIITPVIVHKITAIFFHFMMNRAFKSAVVQTLSSAAPTTTLAPTTAPHVDVDPDPAANTSLDASITSRRRPLVLHSFAALSQQTTAAASATQTTEAPRVIAKP